MLVIWYLWIIYRNLQFSLQQFYIIYYVIYYVFSLSTVLFIIDYKFCKLKMLVIWYLWIIYRNLQFSLQQFLKTHIHINSIWNNNDNH